MSQTLNEKILEIQKLKNQEIVKVEADRAGCPIIWAKKEKVIELLNFLKTKKEFDFLVDLTAYDEMGSEEESLGRFVVVYQLLSHSTFERVRIKVRLQENETIGTAIAVWPGANWAEREVFDMFGVRFEGHPDLRRILMDQRWVGHPLRKDYHWRKYQLFTEPEEIPMHLLKED